MIYRQASRETEAQANAHTDAQGPINIYLDKYIETEQPQTKKMSTATDEQIKTGTKNKQSSFSV